MRLSRLAAAAALTAFAAAPAAAGPHPSDYVEIRINPGPVVCVTEPCNQPPIGTVCVKQPASICYDLPAWPG